MAVPTSQATPRVARLAPAVRDGVRGPRLLLPPCLGAHVADHGLLGHLVALRAASRMRSITE